MFKGALVFLLFVQTWVSCHFNVYYKLAMYNIEKTKGQVVAVSEPKTRTYKVMSIKTERSSDKPFNPTSGKLISKFGKRGRRMHTGIDIAAPRGTRICSMLSGTVVFCGRMHGYGNIIAIRHNDGTISRYAHCSGILVRQGQFVSAGALIGKVGATGNARGSHLHLEVIKNGRFIDPLTVMRHCW
jgi:murein DD-endopeptidase MepM/ murein hydrolase activator NlpD